jgi:hypothetical protein
MMPYTCRGVTAPEDFAGSIQLAVRTVTPLCYTMSYDLLTSWLVHEIFPNALGVPAHIYLQTELS